MDAASSNVRGSDNICPTCGVEGKMSKSGLICYCPNCLFTIWFEAKLITADLDG